MTKERILELRAIADSKRRWGAAGESALATALLETLDALEPALYQLQERQYWIDNPPSEPAPPTPTQQEPERCHVIVASAFDHLGVAHRHASCGEPLPCQKHPQHTCAFCPACAMGLEG